MSCEVKAETVFQSLPRRTFRSSGGFSCSAQLALGREIAMARMHVDTKCVSAGAFDASNAFIFFYAALDVGLVLSAFGCKARLEGCAARKDPHLRSGLWLHGGIRRQP